MSKLISFLFLFLIVSSSMVAQNPRKTKAIIKTSAECEFCKKNIEKNLSKIKGIKKVECDFVKHEISVVFNAKKITLDDLKKQIVALGYDADDQNANFDKFKKIEHKK
jgi:copper chaperone CopZ